MNSELLEELKVKFDLVKENIVKNRKYIHYKSLRNFYYHLYKSLDEKDQVKSIGRYKKIKILINYMDVLLINKDNINRGIDIDSKKYFDEYIYPVGKFMSYKYNFSMRSGLFYRILFFLLIGFSVDCFILNFRLSILSTIISLLFSIIIFYIKTSEKRVFGYFF